MAKNSEGNAAVATETTPSPRYRTRSFNRSETDIDASAGIECPSEGLKFPFFDEPNTSASQNNYDIFLSPPGGNRKESSTQQQKPTIDSSAWETELSPIIRNRSSDASQEVIDVPVMDIYSYSSPPPTMASPQKVSFDIEQVYNTEIPGNAGDDATTKNDDDIDAAKVPVWDLSSAREQVGQSSHEFIERIRNAAHKRKVAMTRSRDSLAAKEEEQLRSIIAERNIQASSSSSSSASQQRDQVWQTAAREASIVDASKKSFKARPLPATTGALGSGGLDGVPKVEKRQTTTPFSPLLGSRRPQKPKVKALEAPKQPEITKPKTTAPVARPTPPIPKMNENDLTRPFKARVVPPAVRSAGSSGQYGVPKVEKRPSTVAMSPQLGLRRRSRSADAKTVSDDHVKETIPKGDTSRRSSVNSSRVTRSRTRSLEVSPKPVDITSESPGLLGLKLLFTPQTDPNQNVENVTPKNAEIKPFEPHSTRRAKKRAEYDSRRKTIFEIRSERVMKERERDIRKMHQELNILRQEL